MKLSHPYDGLLKLVKDRRTQVEEFLLCLERRTNWLTCPASINHHMNVPGGLVAHSLLTTRTLLDLRDTLSPEYKDETCVIVGMFHDVGKVGSEGQPHYRISREQNGLLTYEENKELVTMGLAVRSLYLCARHIPLTDEEAQAICYHDGQYVPDNRAVKNREQPLTLLLHFADLWSSHVTEPCESTRNVHSLLEKMK
ncbi:MAG: phosphohydrolase [Deltaproteobacteria bacterium]|nr:phosphohydrolase [Deltaproteobacteria bacterium]